MNIYFDYHIEKIDFLDELKIENLILKIGEDHKKVIGDIFYSFVSDGEILKINQDFLKHDYFTDIITFDNSFVNIINGEIFISFDTVKSNSMKFGTEFSLEMYRVIIHGIMHLCGFKDSTEEEKKVMRQKENEYISYLEKL